MAVMLRVAAGNTGKDLVVEIVFKPLSQWVSVVCQLLANIARVCPRWL
jgi:hypothetical protein